ncbi:MAG: hypothetical protein NVSMB25_08260 [Thermoleophilaceae bacterium]
MAAMRSQTTALETRRGMRTVNPLLRAGRPAALEPRRPGRSSIGLGSLTACIALAAASLAISATPTFDPMAWITWGREIAHLNLVTSGDGPSWKPLPVLFTTVFSVFGDAAPALWLVVARAGGLAGVVLAYRLATRVAGRRAGVATAVALVTTTDFLGYLMPGGLSEPLCAALALLAIERHLEQRHDHALLALFAASLLRPEAWPFLAGYCVFVLWRSRARWPLVAGLALALVLAWFLPDYLGSGDWLRSAHRAAHPTHGGALLDRHPALGVLQNAVEYLTIVPLGVCAVLATLVAAIRFRRRREAGLVCAVAALMLAWVALEAAMTQLHTSAGDARYLMVAGAFASVLAGIGFAWLLASAASLAARRGAGTRRRASTASAGVAAAVLAACAPFAIAALDDLRLQHRAISHDIVLWDTLPQLIRHAGGRRAILACGGVAAEPFWIPAVAWRLKVHLDDVGFVARPPGSLFRNHLFASAPLDPPEGPGYSRVASAGHDSHAWLLSARCRTRAGLPSTG